MAGTCLAALLAGSLPACTSKGPPQVEPNSREVRSGGVPSELPSGGVVLPNVLVTADQTGAYRRYDGGTDPTTRTCSTGRRAQNEPSIAVDPRDPSVVAVGANDSCAEIENGLPWVGYYRSTDGGETWHDSLVPGYAGDTSDGGVASPAHDACVLGSDPTLSFDRDGRLFFGFICLTPDASNGGQSPFSGSSTYVAVYEGDGSRYVRTLLIARGSRSADEDKINLAVDQTGGRFSGNVYAAWVELAPPSPGGFPRDVLRFSRSTDHGRTFSAPAVPSLLAHATFPDVAVGPDGAVYVTFRVGDEIWLVKSANGGRSFRPAHLVQLMGVPFDSDEFTGGAGRECGDGPFACKTGFTLPRFGSYGTVAADETGVHVAWNERNEANQSKVFVRTSPDGLSWTAAPVPVDTVTVGHQWFPDMASADGVISLAFYDSRHDPAFGPFLPPGNTADGKNSGDVVEVVLAQSSDGGGTWAERVVSDHPINPNYETFDRQPFFGDYLYVSAVPGAVAVAWTDSRDVVPGDDPRESGPSDDHDAFDVLQPCNFVPGNIEAKRYDAPQLDNPCLSRGGSDENIYAARL